MLLKKIGSIVFASALMSAALTATAQAPAIYPNRAVKLVVPSTAGGTTDVIARSVADKLATAFGQPFIIDNKPGANGILATQAVVKAPPDGHTLLIMYTAYVQNLALRTDSPYSMKDLIPLSQIMASATMMVVPASLGVNTLAEFVALVRANPNKYAYGSFGTGSTAHVAGEALNAAAKIDVRHVPYKGETAAMTDLLGGQIAVAWGAAGTFLPHVKSGKLKFIAGTGVNRVALIPDVPTFKEAGYPTVTIPGWNGIFVPVGTPPAIVRRLSEELGKAAKSNEVSARIIDLGLEPVGSTAAEFASFLDSEMKQWTNIVKLTGIKQE